MIKFGIAGFGKMGKIRAETIRLNNQARLVAVFEQDESLLEHLPDDIYRCSSFSELLEQDVEAIFVCAFNNVAAEYSIEALSKGKHVFCEKPPARNCLELTSVIEAEQNSGLVLKYGFNHRHHYSVQEAKKIIDRGEMGALLWLRGFYGKAGSIDYHQNWRNYKKYSGGGILMDQGIHMLDLFYYLSGKEYTVESSHLDSMYWNTEVEDNAFIVLKSGKVVATMHSSATQWKHKFLIEMCFENGYINLDGILSESRSYTPETLVTGKREFEDITFAMGKPAESTTWFENDDSWKLELEEFIDAIEGGSIRHGTSHDAHQVMELLENIYHKSGFYAS